MEYVMVPVPEEIVGLVKDYLNWQLNQPKIVENSDAVRQVYDEADPDLRVLIHHIAEVTLGGDLATLTGTADSTGLSPREVMGALGELLARLVAAGRTAPLIMPRIDPRELPEGTQPSQHRVLQMAEVDAAMIVEF